MGLISRVSSRTYRHSPALKILLTRRLLSLSRPKTFPKMIIGTHSGSFHCDDAMAVALLKTLDRYSGAQVIRSRDPEVWKTCDIIVDVGGEYTPEKHIYDHHQRSFTQVLGDVVAPLKGQPWASRTKLSSAGLVYAHFGREILKKMVQEEGQENEADNEDLLDRPYKHCYEKLVEEVDAVDNGIDQYTGDNLTRHYSVTTTLGSRVAQLNPDWTVENPDFDANFPTANAICLEAFKDRVRGFLSWYKAREIVVKAVDNRFEVDPSGQVLDFSEKFCPWKEHLSNLEEEGYLEADKILYVLYGKDGDRRVQCVPKEKGSFANRKSLPESWRGKRDNEFCKETGLSELIFCHAGGFLCGARTRESQVELVKMALKA